QKMASVDGPRWETVTERETAHGPEVIRYGVETRQLPQPYVDRGYAASRAVKRALVRIAAVVILLVAIGSLIVARVSDVALGVIGLVIAGLLVALVAWWARRPEATHERMVYFRRYGPFRTWVKSSADDEDDFYLEVATHTLSIN